MNRVPTSPPAAASRGEPRAGGLLVAVIATTALVAALVLGLQLAAPFSYYDEGMIAAGADVLARGGTLYRDFWVPYPPGQFVVVAALFRLFGPGLLVVRLYDLALRLGLVLLVAVTARRVAPPANAVLAALAAALALAAMRSPGYPVLPALALVLGAFALALAGGHARLVTAGLLLGLAACCRYDTAAYGAVAIAAALLLRVPDAAASARAGRARDLALVFAPAVAIVALLAAALVAAGVGAEAWRQTVRHLPGTYLATRWKPYPGPLPPLRTAARALGGDGDALLALGAWAWLYVPLAALLATVVELGARARAARRFPAAAPDADLAALALLAALLLVTLLARFDRVHAMPATLPLWALLAAEPWRERLRRRSPARLAVARAFVALAALAFLAPALSRVVDAARAWPPGGSSAGLPRATGVTLAADEAACARFVAAATRAGEFVYVGTARHDLAFANDAGLGFLAARPAPTRYVLLDPGVTTAAPAQREIVRDLESRHVRWAVLADLPASGERNASANASGVRVLDDYLAAHFAPVAQFGGYEVRRRVEPGSPAPR